MRRLQERCENAGFTNGYPGQQEIAEQFTRRFGNLPGGRNLTRIVPETIYHRRNFPNNGSTEMTFFNESKSLGITNLQVAGQMPANHFFAALTMRFDFLYGIDRLGSRSAVSATASKTALSYTSDDDDTNENFAVTVSKAAEKVRELLSQGTVTLLIGDQPVFEVYGLNNFPSGKGVQALFGMAAAVAEGNAAIKSQGGAIGSITNGDPNMCNAFPFHDAFPIAPGQTFRVQVQWNSAVDFTNADLGPLNGETAGNTAGVLMCELVGVTYKPASA